MDRETLERFIIGREYEHHQLGDVVVRIRSLTADEVRRYYQTVLDNRLWKESLVAYCLVDELGEPLYRPSEIGHIFANFNHRWLDALYQLCQQLTATEILDDGQTQRSAEISPEQQQGSRAIYEAIGQVFDPVE